MNRFCWMIALTLMGTLGCAPNEPTTGSEAHKHFPEHWPYTLQNAAVRLKDFVDNRGATAPKASVDLRREYADLIEWLPILTADSDFDRSVFDRIDRWSSEELQRLQKLPPSETIERIVSDPNVAAHVAWMQEVCEAEQRRIDSLLQ